MNTMIKELMQIASEHTDTIWDTIRSIWFYILNQPKEKQCDVFTQFLSNVELDDLQHERGDSYYQIKEFAMQDIDLLAERILKNLIQQNMAEQQFYDSLWVKILDPTLLPDQDAKIAFLLRLWVDVRIPYYQINKGCTMDNDEFQAILKTISPKLKKANFILAIPFHQKTQRASLLMELADEIEEPREKTVFWANVIAQISSMKQIRRITEHEES